MLKDFLVIDETNSSFTQLFIKKDGKSYGRFAVVFPPTKREHDKSKRKEMYEVYLDFPQSTCQRFYNEIGDAIDYCCKSYERFIKKMNNLC